MIAPSATTICSFCAKSEKEVGRMVAGPGVCICNECVGLCGELVATASTPGLRRMAPWEHAEQLDEVLTTLPRVAGAARQVEDHLTGWIRRARELGSTWQQIGDALGMTRQSAWERFAADT